MKYRIYANVQGWKIIDMKTNLEDAIKVVDDLVAIEVNEFIVVESSRENGDVPIISNMRSYLNRKEELEKQKQKRLGSKA